MYHYILCIVITYKFSYKESLYSEFTAVLKERVLEDDQSRDGEIYWIKHKIIYSYITSHFSHFLTTAGLESVSLGHF